MATVYRSAATNSQRGNLTAARANLSRNNSGPVSGGEIAEFWSRDEAELYEQYASSIQNYSASYVSPYFDYFFSGQDVSIKIEGMIDRETLPIYNFAWVVEQQKQPVYGIWSHTYDAMLRGTRIVSGAFTLVCDGPATLTKAIASASAMRARIVKNGHNNSLNIHALRGLDEDEENIDKYWARHYDSNLDAGQQHIFSIHPPFNFIIQYGIQQTSMIAKNPLMRADEFALKYDNNSMMSTDYNERLVRIPVEAEDFQTLIENVEILNKAVQVDSDGNPILETYTFIARDERILSSSVYTRPTTLSSGDGGGSSGPPPSET